MAIIAGYDFARFKHLLRTGKGIGGRELGDMSEVSRDAFVHFSDEEIADLYAFLRERIDLPNEAVGRE